MATYRLQLTPQFRFADAARVTEYLARLGVSHLYLSPVFEAVPGSRHGYDVTDPTRLRAELGGEPGFSRLCDRARVLGLGVILDIVPNHMAADWASPSWRDVLRHGHASSWASWFDIDWTVGAGRVVLPVLGEPLEEVVARGQIRSSRRAGEPVLEYFGRAFPIASGTEPQSDAPGDLRECLKAQHYTLVHWRDTSPNYRRFFDINDLVSIRVEDPAVFDATHTLVRRLVHDGLIDGIRVDHVDGLADPQEYLARLRALIGPDAYLVVEKILGPEEPLRPSWPVDGTTGYEFLNATARLFVEPQGFAALEQYWRESTGQKADFREFAHAGKREVAGTLFGAELNRLSALLVSIGRSRGASFDEQQAGAAVTECTALLGVYRTYLAGHGLNDQDLSALAGPLAGIGEGIAARVLREVLLDRAPGPLERTFVRLWQQFSGPVAAKGVEDTALYRHTALVALNEVGGEPELRGDSRSEFCALCRSRQEHFPWSMNATATHDTKRGEDTRVRIAALSELGTEWVEAVDRWRGWHAEIRTADSAGCSPRIEDELLAYQTLIGVWPAEHPLASVGDRVAEYLVKAAREAKVRTSWLRADAEYEEGIRNFVKALTGGREGERFRADAADLRRRAALLGLISSVSQVVLKAAAPGVPDFFQGTEQVSLSLVDPDNRREVDFAGLERSLDSVASEQSPATLTLPTAWPDGRIKQFVTWRALAARKSAAFRGGFESLRVSGGHAERVVAFARRHATDCAVVIAGVRLGPLTDGGREWIRAEDWRDTVVHLEPDMPRQWVDALMDHRHVQGDVDRLYMRDVLSVLPAAILLPSATGR